MPAELERLVKKLMRQGYDKDSAYAIASSKTGWVKAKGGGWVKRKRKRRRRKR